MTGQAQRSNHRRIEPNQAFSAVKPEDDLQSCTFSDESGGDGCREERCQNVLTRTSSNTAVAVAAVLWLVTGSPMTTPSAIGNEMPPS